MLKYRREKLTLVFDLCIFGAITLQLLAFILARCLPVSSESMYGIYTAARICSVILVLACPYCGANVQGKEQTCRICGKNMYGKSI